MVVVAERELRGLAVAELTAENRSRNRTATSTAWTISSRECAVDAAIAEALPSERLKGATASGDYVRTVLTDEIAVKIDSAEYVRNRLVLMNGEEVEHVSDGSRCLSPRREAGRTCGCSSSAFQRKALARSGVGPSPDVLVLFRLLGAPQVGPVLLRSTSWDLYFSLRGLLLNQKWESGPIEACIKLQRELLRTRSGLEVFLVKQVIECGGAASPENFHAVGRGRWQGSHPSSG